ncbi:hypothetical protein ACF3DV_22390 [Chlorogloeopsis fritschii PCC 9212]|uniref:Uncharacterized protein n=1 Tax=Chlorogloeopsis fritschii PCC 6912 TaxID=211165 RepID=A0A433N4H3_CHLFR|nr:hypothetical protein [Chlorogloeopsis fritschii]RUR76227.1 hypothetical protein PCC6912_43990 [Chlorogloeopsis fritschii PCC 6912]
MKNNSYCKSKSKWKYTKTFLKSLSIQLILIWSFGIWILLETNSQATSISENWKLLSKLLEQKTSVKDLKPNPLCLNRYNSNSTIILHQLEQKSFLIAAPENLNPGLQLPPPIPPAPPKIPNNFTPPSTDTESSKPFAVLENIQTDFRNDTDNFGQHNLFIEPTFQFRLRNGNKLFVKSGLELFEQRDVELVTNIPLQIGWQGKFGQVIFVGWALRNFPQILSFTLWKVPTLRLFWLLTPKFYLDNLPFHFTDAKI